MGQIMTNSFQGGTFDPVESEDYVAPLSQSYKEINADMDNTGLRNSVMKNIKHKMLVKVLKLYHKCQEPYLNI